MCAFNHCWATRMTEDWDFYFVRVEGKLASMFVDLGAHSAAPNPNLPFMAYVRLHLKRPRENGLSSQDEFETLVAIEDALKAALVGESIDYVGRATTNSCRDFVFYVAPQTDWQTQVAACIRSFDGYQYIAETREESDWSTYFNYLYPSDEDRQVIENRRVCETLESHGDLLSVAREIDHWAYFSDAKALNAYAADAQKLGFNVRELIHPDQNSARHCAQLWRLDTPAYDSIDGITLPLFNMAVTHGGEYDGWESVVVKDNLASN